MRKSTKILLITVVSIVVVVVLATPIGLYAMGEYIFDEITYSEPECTGAQDNKPEKYDAIRDDIVLSHDISEYWFDDYQQVTILTENDTLPISTYVVERNTSQQWVILVHGVRNCKWHHEVLLPAGMLINAGFNVLLLDLRNHGKSGTTDGFITGGQQEWQDVKAVYEWLLDNKGVESENIGLYGISLGAATAAIAFSQIEYIKSAWLDSSFYNIKRTLERELELINIPSYLAFTAIIVADWFHGIDLDEFSPADASRLSQNRSLFFVHNVTDDRIAFEQGNDLCDLAKVNSSGGYVECWFTNSELHIPDKIDPTTHAATQLTHTKEYEKKLIEFFSNELGK